MKQIYQKWIIKNIIASFIIAMSLNISANAQDKELWRVGCSASGNKICSLRATQVAKNGKRIIARIDIATQNRNNKKIWVMNALFPLGLAIQEGVGFRVDDDNGILPLQLQSCDKEHCKANGQISANAINKMKRGEIVQLVYTDTKDGKLKGVGFPLKDFTKNFAQLILKLTK